MKDEIKILIADDHPLMRNGIAAVLEEEPGFCVCAHATNGNEAYKKLKETGFDIVTLDIEMPEMSGLELARKIGEENIDTRIIFLTMHKDEDMFNEAMDSGASGYVLKDNAVNDIVNCVKEVSNGGYYISPLISQFLVKRQHSVNKLSSSSPSINDLTKSERKILKMISNNHTSKEIAGELFISIKTVENHRSNISKKLDLHGSHSLVKFAIQNKSIL